MKCHRVNELIELLHPAWQKEPDLNLVQFLQNLAQEAGFEGQLNELTDDILIYHLKMRDADKEQVIPGLKKDYEEDFKTAFYDHRNALQRRHVCSRIPHHFEKAGTRPAANRIY